MDRSPAQGMAHGGSVVNEVHPTGARSASVAERASVRGVSRVDDARSDLPAPVRRFVCSVRTMALISFVAFVVVLVLFTQTARAQRWEEQARYSVGSSARAWAVIVDPMTLISMGSVACVLAVFVAVAVMRRRFSLALAALFVVGASNVTTQLFKAWWPTRPHFWDNSLPSGHSTAAMSVSIAALLVAPSWARRWLLPFAGFVATFVGAGTIVGHWHRPPDVWAAYLVCLFWAAVAVGLVLRIQHRRRTRDARYAMRPALGLLGSVAAGLLFLVVGVRPADDDLRLVQAVISLGGIGLLAAIVLAWVSAVADDNLG